ncbi:acetate kinase [Halanaerobium congolense]|uniref:Acetate kinase n=1 Tax=Halanaerobium congolense TaxID=54121 RepID=A0A1G8JAD0_9FIRM|nr:acetate kinase [Halanaerobium congolense]PUU90540.1 MAG: acetate kinase [Halanaerobium sp.]SDI28033.1 acetate kinase [Halanaerobium congolense]SES81012.1 acetate kinase [Halanaerobium congolense]
MKILVINSGSSSLKFQLFNMENENVLAQGLFQRIGINNSYLEFNNNQDELIIEKEIPDHITAVKLLIDTLLSKDQGVLKSMEEIEAVGHRLVHGGEKYKQTVIINEEIIKQLEKTVELAPLHIPPNIAGIKICQKLLPNKAQIGVFDTAFHHTIPEKAYVYALPYKYYQKHKIRKYGFHGTSHKYIAKRTAKLLDKPVEELKIISCHLGNGASITAVKNGKSIETSMGFTPLEGLVMGTRSGDFDPAIIPFLLKKENLKISELDDVLNKKSGLLGVSGVSSDFRDIENAAAKGKKQAQLAIKLFNYRVQKYIGAYAAVMNGVDAVTFSAGIGENSISVRKNILNELGYLGITLDNEKNKVRGQEKIISADNSKVKALVIPTNEELVIARETLEILNR